jgi:hypothetical protein
MVLGRHINPERCHYGAVGREIALVHLCTLNISLKALAYSQCLMSAELNQKYFTSFKSTMVST